MPPWKPPDHVCSFLISRLQDGVLKQDNETRYSLPFLIHRARASSMDRRTWLGAGSSHCWLSHSTHRGGWASSGSLLSGCKTGGLILTCVFQALLTNLAGKVSSAKEVLMALLEQIDQFKSSLAVTRLLPALGISLLRIKERTMSHTWAWALSTLRCHLSTVSVPVNR